MCIPERIGYYRALYCIFSMCRRSIVFIFIQYIIPAGETLI